MDDWRKALNEYPMEVKDEFSKLCSKHLLDMGRTFQKIVDTTKYHYNINILSFQYLSTH